MTISTWIRNWKHKRRERRVSQKCGCVCYCPACNDILNDQAEVTDGVERGHYFYQCGCGVRSEWHFVAVPFPLCIDQPCKGSEGLAKAVRAEMEHVRQQQATESP